MTWVGWEAVDVDLSFGRVDHVPHRVAFENFDRPPRPGSALVCLPQLVGSFDRGGRQVQEGLHDGSRRDDESCWSLAPKSGGTKRVSDAGESVWRLSSIANSANTAKHVCAEWLALTLPGEGPGYGPSPRPSTSIAKPWFEPERCKRCKASLRGFQIGLEQSVQIVRLAKGAPCSRQS